MMFQNREEAGSLLAQKLKRYKEKTKTVVLGLARGGIAVAHVVATQLKLPLDVVVIKKIGAPNSPELAIGAVGPKNTIYWDEELCKRLGINTRIKNQELRIRNQERREREKILRRGKKVLDIAGKTIILVDDGVATGATVLCAQKFLRKQRVKEVILAVPVISKDTLSFISEHFDRVIVLSIEESFYAVGQFYKDFPQVSDEEVIRILNSK